jgi:hypothetical protein
MNHFTSALHYVYNIKVMVTCIIITITMRVYIYISYDYAGVIMSRFIQYIILCAVIYNAHPSQVCSCLYTLVSPPVVPRRAASLLLQRRDCVGVPATNLGRHRLRR